MPTEERARYPDIPWPEIVGLRNRLIHAYDSVDFDVADRERRFATAYLIAALEEALGIARGEEQP